MGENNGHYFTSQMNKLQFPSYSRSYQDSFHGYCYPTSTPIYSSPSLSPYPSLSISTYLPYTRRLNSNSLYQYATSSSGRSLCSQNQLRSTGNLQYGYSSISPFQQNRKEYPAELKRPDLVEPKNKVESHLFNPRTGGNLMKVLQVSTPDKLEVSQPSGPNPFKCGKPTRDVLRALREEFKRKKRMEEGASECELTSEDHESFTGEIQERDSSISMKRLPKLQFCGVTQRSRAADNNVEDSVYITKGKSRVSHVDMGSIDDQLKRENKLEQIKMKIKVEEESPQAPSMSFDQVITGGTVDMAILKTQNRVFQKVSKTRRTWKSSCGTFMSSESLRTMFGKWSRKFKNTTIRKQIRGAHCKTNMNSGVIDESDMEEAHVGSIETDQNLREIHQQSLETSGCGHYSVSPAISNETTNLVFKFKRNPDSLEELEPEMAFSYSLLNESETKIRLKKNANGDKKENMDYTYCTGDGESVKNID